MVHPVTVGGRHMQNAAEASAGRFCKALLAAVGLGTHAGSRMQPGPASHWPHLVQDQNLGLSQDGPGHAEQLPLACAQVTASFSDACIQASLLAMRRLS